MLDFDSRYEICGYNVGRNPHYDVREEANGALQGGDTLDLLETGSCLVSYEDFLVVRS